MDQGKKKEVRGAFFCEKPDGTITDQAIVDEMLIHEDSIRQELIDAGVIRNIVLVKKKPNNKK